MLMIATVLKKSKIGVRTDWKKVESFDDFVLRQASVTTDDLLVIISARRASVSFDSDMDSVPPFLQRYFPSHNLIMIYPGQFGTEQPMTMAETMATDIVSPPSPIYGFLINLARKLRKQ